MKSNNPLLVQSDIKKQYHKHFSSEKEVEVQHLKQMLMYRFLSEVERIAEEKDINRAELAKAIGVSGSYLTQLYRGNKPLNFETLAKLELELDFRFDVQAVSQEMIEIDHSIETTWDEFQINTFINKFKCKDGYWIYKNKNKSESKSDEIQFEPRIIPTKKIKLAS